MLPIPRPSKLNRVKYVFLHAPLSVRITVILLVLMLLMWFPVTGFFLMFFGFILFPLTGILFIAMLGAIVWDVFTKKIPVYALGIPIVLLSVYYGFYFTQDTTLIANLTSQIQQTNSQPIPQYEYDGTVVSINDKFGSVQSLMSEFGVPVVYSGSPAKQILFAVATQEVCDELKTTPIYPIETYRKLDRNNPETPGYCLVHSEYVTRPAKVYDIAIEKSIDEEHSITQITDVVTVGDVLYKRLSAQVLTLQIVPFYMFGCGLNSREASWDCGIVPSYKRAFLPGSYRNVSDGRLFNISALMGSIASFNDYTYNFDLYGFREKPYQTALRSIQDINSVFGIDTSLSDDERWIDMVVIPHLRDGDSVLCFECDNEIFFNNDLSVTYQEKLKQEQISLIEQLEDSYLASAKISSRTKEKIAIENRIHLLHRKINLTQLILSEPITANWD